MGRAVLVLLLLASVAGAGDPPTFQGLTADQWAARLADPSTRDEAGAALATGTPEAVVVVKALPDVQPVVAALIVLLADDGPSVRLHAALVLWRIGHAGAAAVPALVRALSDAEQDVADNAMGALGSIGSAAVPALIGAMSDPHVRGRAADALGRIGPAAAAAVEPLLALLKDKAATWKERGNAADALGEIGAPAAAAVPDLARGLSDPEDWIRRECGEALGKMGDAAVPAVPALLDALADSYEPAAEEARDALWRLGDPAIRLLVERFRKSDDRATLGAALASGGRKSLPYLVPLLTDPDAPWRRDAESALVLVGWEALYALPADHPSASAVAAGILTEGVVRRVQPPKRYRAVATAPPKVDALPTEATWETGNGHGFTLALHRGHWTPEGFAVRTISYAWRWREKESETIAVRTTTIPRARAEAMWRMVLAATGVTFEEEGKSDGTFWSSSRDFHAVLTFRGGTLTYHDSYTGYAGSLERLAYARVVACTEILGEGLDTCDWAEAAPSDEDQAVLAARLSRITKDDWWVRERLLLMAKAIGDGRCLPPIEAFLATEPDETPRDHGYAIDAYARISGIDLRPTPFRDEDVAATRLRYLAHFAKRDGR